MSLAGENESGNKLTEIEVLKLIADALDTEPSLIVRGTKSSDIPNWDSMGLLGLISALDRHGINCSLGNTDSLQSVDGIIDIVKKAGKLN